MQCTFRIGDTFGMTIWWRADKIGKTRTGRTIIFDDALWVSSAWWRYTRISMVLRWRLILNWSRGDVNFNKVLFFLLILTDKGFDLLMGWQRMNGFPVKRGLQLHMGLWLTTEHSAFIPHVPGHGSLHFWFEQASFNGQSGLTTHSGWHVGGIPIKPTTHEHTDWPLNSLHWLLGPHGDGLHGVWVLTAKSGVIFFFKIMSAKILW